MLDKSIQELAGMLALPYRINHIPEWKVPMVARAPNRPARKRNTPNHIPVRDTVHGTANFNPGASAAMHEKYVRAPNWGGPDKTSYHHVVDDVECIELLPWEEVANHGGTTASNVGWLGAEICENEGHYGPKALDNAAKLFACKMVKFEKPLSWIVQHNAAYGKDCPNRLRHTPGGWEAFLQQVSQHAAVLNRLLTAGTHPGTGMGSGYEVVPGTDFMVGGAIGAFWRGNGGIFIFGLPLGNEAQNVVLEDGQAYTVQEFERSVMHWRPGEGVGLKRVVVENRALAAEVERLKAEIELLRQG